MINKFKAHRRVYVGILVSVLAIIFVIWQRDSILRSLKALTQADWAYVGLATATFAFTIVFAATIVYILKMHNMAYKNTLLVQTSGLFLGRVTPANVGSLAAMGRYLVLQKHSIVQAGTVLAASAVVTFLGNMVITLFALVANWQNINFGALSIPPFILVIFGVFALVIFLVLIIFSSLRSKIKSSFLEVINTLKAYSHKPKSIILAILFGALLTFSFALTMILIAYSLDVKLSIFAAIITVSLGSLGVAVTPLPGGAVGSEAALAATLVQFGVSAEQALAIALVYRFVTFWMPLLPGYIASQYALSKKII